MIRLSSLSPNSQHEVMHSPWPEFFQSSQCPEKSFRAPSVQSHWYPHYRPASLNIESGFQKHVFNVGNLVVVLFRGSYTEEEQKSSQKIIGLKSNETFTARLQRTEHSLQSLNWLLEKVERSYA